VNAGETSETSAEDVLRVLGTLGEEARHRRARSRRNRLRTKRSLLACFGLATIALAVFSILVMSGTIQRRVLHAKVSESKSSSQSIQPTVASAVRPTNTRRSTPAVVAPLAHKPAAPKPKPARAAPVTPSASLVVRAVRGPSWIMARRGNSTGKLLYEGTLAQSGTLSLRAPRVWVTFGALANLELRLNGEPVTLVHTGTVEAVFTPSGVKPA
jgi:RodZ C-terminal domain